MFLTNAHTTCFKSIDNSENVLIDKKVTVLVGQNESGKTAFLQSLYKSLAVEKEIKYDIVNDYPRKWLMDYDERHEGEHAEVLKITFELTKEEIISINNDLNCNLIEGIKFTLNYSYDNKFTVSFNLNEDEFAREYLSKSCLHKDIKDKFINSKNLIELIGFLENEDLNEESKVFINEIKTKFTVHGSWKTKPVALYIWTQHIKPNLPEFIYFDEYKLLPAKVNLPDLQRRINNNTHTDEDKTVMSLLKLAKVSIDDLITPEGYEKNKAKLEGISNNITDKIFKFWTQNQELHVEFDVKEDAQDHPPFNSGINLYIRIRNQRHRVSVPFDQRSKGFIWFFSFLVWFDSIKKLSTTNKDFIILLDEPGLNLHAVAQKDFLNYIDYLTDKYQIIYTTHSPFMIHNDRLHQVRMVEDTKKYSTRITSDISGSDPSTIFPLQAALGYTVAQNLFISKRNLLVEGPSDLVYLNFFSSVLEQKNRTSLREDITIVPVGGLDKLSTFVALLGANELEIVVLHDFVKTQVKTNLDTLISQKIIKDKQVLNYSLFRDEKSKTPINLLSTDVEDLLTPDTFLKLFNEAYKKELNGLEIKEKDLPTADRIIQRIEIYLKSNSILLRPSGGFNHYLVANHLASNPISTNKIGEPMLKRFENLFNKINNLISEPDTKDN